MKTNLFNGAKVLTATVAFALIGISTNAQTTIYQTIQGSVNHTVLEQAIDAVPGLSTTLDDPNADLTVFAPDDDAFTAALNELGLTAPALLGNTALLTDILNYHVLSGTVPSSALSNGQIEQPLNNANTVKFTIDGTDAYINQSLIDGADIAVTNGALHSMDQVILFDETVADVVIDSPDHTTLEAAVVEARLLPALTNPFSQLTVFAPTDDAFVEALDSLNITAGDLLADANLGDILLYHVLGAEALAADLSNGQLATPLNTANTIKVTIDGTDVFANHALVSGPDAGDVDNGVVHVIDDVIFANETVADIAIDSPDHSTLVAAVIEARLLPALTHPFLNLTVFAPTDDAFTEALDSLGITAGDLLADPTLPNTLLYHVLGFEVQSGDLFNGAVATPLNTANTVKVTIDGTDVFVNHAQVTSADNLADNGVVHVLGDVILPVETVADVAIDSPDHTTLVAAVVEARLLPALTNPFAEFTLFAPTDAAFTQFLTDEGITAGDLLSSPDLADILLYHALGSEVLSTDLTDGPVATLNGADIVVDLSNGVMINSANVTGADNTTDNGVVHVIDYVLNPAEASIEELTVQTVEMYPNPATSVINVKDLNNANYSIVNMAGAEVLSGSINGPIAIDNLQEGTYFINITDENNVYRTRFIKM